MFRYSSQSTLLAIPDLALMSKRIFFPLFLFVASIQGCSSPSHPQFQSATQNDAKMGNLVLAEPAPVNIRSQMALARLTDILSRVEVPDNQKAEFLYQRGVLYDSVGLSGMAQYDFNRALRLNPNMAEAHNFMGIHYTQNMDFIQAYDEFDATLDIDPEHDFAFLNRGIALYYGGRPELAVQDLTSFYQKDKSDPYRALWAFIAEKAIDEKAALEKLRDVRGYLSDQNWATTLVDFYLGEVSESQVLSDLMSGVTNQKQLTDKLCEAYFYLGKYHADKDQKGIAANYFKLALSTNVYSFVEHRYARLELELMRERTYQEEDIVAN